MKKMMEELLQLAKKEAIAENASANVESIVQSSIEELQFIYKKATFAIRVVGQPKEAVISREALSSNYKKHI